LLLSIIYIILYIIINRINKFLTNLFFFLFIYKQNLALYSSTDYRNPLSYRDNTNRTNINNNNNNNHSYNNNINPSSSSSNRNKRQGSNHLSSDSPSNNQSSAFDYPFHFKSQNTAYAAPSSTEYNQRFGSYTSNSNSTLYTPSVGGVNSQHHYAPSNQSHSTHGFTTHNNTNHNNTANANTKKNLFSKSTLFNLTSNANSSADTTPKPKKKFGFNINTNPQAFYSNYPPVGPSNSHHLTPNSTSSHPSSSSHGHHSNVGSPSSPTSSRKFGHHPTGSNLNSPTFTPPSSGPKSKKRMFGVNYKLNG